jgi:hypothetical protein
MNGKFPICFCFFPLTALLPGYIQIATEILRWQDVGALNRRIICHARRPGERIRDDPYDLATTLGAARF